MNIVFVYGDLLLAFRQNLQMRQWTHAEFLNKNYPKERRSVCIQNVMLFARSLWKGRLNILLR